MSRPGSYHDGPGYAFGDEYDNGGFSLPLFNHHPPSIPTHDKSHSTSTIPAPSAPPPVGHTARHSFAHPPPPPLTTSLPPAPGAFTPGKSRPPASGRSMTSGQGGYAYPEPSPARQHRVEELMPPPPSGGLGALARSASLGARKKDPYSYSSDDVESGLGSMDVRDGWTGYQGRVQSFAGYPTDVDVPMSPGTNGQPAVNHLTRPTPDRLNSGGSSPARPVYTSHSSSGSIPNPYAPRADPSPSAQWTEYRRPPTGGLHPSSSYTSPASEQLSPYAPGDSLVPSPHSPGLNPYDSSPALTPGQLPTSSPNPGAAHWSSSSYIPSSPSAPPNPRASSSHQIYPASQPVTPAKMYDAGPPRGPPPSTSRQGLRDVRDWSDLKAVVNEHPGGRRVDPNAMGKYLSPLKCVTQQLPSTYTLCNPNYHYETSDNPRRVLTKPSVPVHNDGADNTDWDYILYVNDVLGGEHGGDRYLILDVLGQGTFGQVVKCQNMRTHELCAVKVVKNKPAYLNQSKMEVAILDLLNGTYDPTDTHHMVRMLESFTHKNHLCLVFECLSSNLYELIKQNQFKGLSTQLVKVFTAQLLECLAVLKDARLIHCDLKPENILLKSLQSPQIKVIDFGSACHEMQTVYTYIQSRFYRCPEVLLGLPYSTSIDMWSLGCIVVELFLGLPIFPGTSEYNQISRIVDMLGTPPGHLLEVGKQTHEFFNFVGVDAHGRKQYKLKSMEQYAKEHRTTEQPSKQYFKQRKLKDIIMEYPMQKKNPKQSDIEKEMTTRKAFVDFVEGLLNLDPIKRWSPQQAAKHPFILGDKLNTPFQPPTGPKTTVAPDPSPQKKYGGLVQSPSNRQPRVYSDAAAYNQQLAQHQSYTAQVQSASSAPRPGPFSPGYEPTASFSPQRPRLPSQHAASSSWAPMGPPQNYQPRVASQSTSQPSRQAPPTNPPPNSYYPSSRNRANTINQMDAIPPALARLTHFGVQDPSGTRNLTPVLNRDEAMREWERRQAGHSKKSSMAHTSYPQLEYLQEQAELAAMGGQWMMPGQYSAPPIPPSGHRKQGSIGAGMAGYQMQPHIGVAPTSPGGPTYSGNEYRPRPAPIATGSEYDPPSLGPNTPGRSYLPAYPPPAAHSQPGSATFDGFTDGREPALGMLYTPLQPAQAAYASPSGYGLGVGAGHPGHQTRASFSGPFHGAGGNGNPNNPFAGAPGQGSPRYQRRSGQYGV